MRRVGGRDDDLTAVPNRHHTGSLVDRVGDVAAVAWIGQAGVNPDPHPYHRVVRPWFSAQRLLPCRTGSERGRGIGKRDEERVTLRRHLRTAMRVPGVSQNPSVPLEQQRIPVTDAVEQPCGPLDVSEHEGHHPGRQRWHGPIITHRRGPQVVAPRRSAICGRDLATHVGARLGHVARERCVGCASTSSGLGDGGHQSCALPTRVHASGSRAATAPDRGGSAGSTRHGCARRTVPPWGP